MGCAASPPRPDLAGTWAAEAGSQWRNAFCRAHPAPLPVSTCPGSATSAAPMGPATSVFVAPMRMGGQAGVEGQPRHESPHPRHPREGLHDRLPALLSGDHQQSASARASESWAPLLHRPRECMTESESDSPRITRGWGARGSSDAQEQARTLPAVVEVVVPCSISR